MLWHMYIKRGTVCVMVAIASALPGASYDVATSSFIIPFGALNAQLGAQTLSPVDSLETLVYGLLEIQNRRKEAGTIGQVDQALEITSKSVSTGIWETSINRFDSKVLVSFLATLCFDAVPPESGADITQL